MTHTKGKLTLDHRFPGVIRDDAGRQIFTANLRHDGTMSDEERNANAARLALCWNAMDEVQEVLREILTERDRAYHQFTAMNTTTWVRRARELLKRLDSAQAEGKG